LFETVQDEINQKIAGLFNPHGEEGLSFLFLADTIILDLGGVHVVKVFERVKTTRVILHLVLEIVCTIQIHWPVVDLHLLAVSA
jgi:hypothetical protein